MSTLVNVSDFTGSPHFFLVKQIEFKKKGNIVHRQYDLSLLNKTSLNPERQSAATEIHYSSFLLFFDFLNRIIIIFDLVYCSVKKYDKKAHDHVQKQLRSEAGWMFFQDLKNLQDFSRIVLCCQWND